MGTTHENVNRMLSELEPYRLDGHAYSLVPGTSVGLRASLAGDAVYIMKIRTEAERRGRGGASKTLQRLCDLADQCGTVLFLEVEESDGLTSQQLADW